MILDKHYWWTNDRESIVPDGHPDAAFLAFAKGHELADNVARTYGIPIHGEGDSDDADPGEDDESVGGDNGDESAKTGTEEPQQQQEKAKPAPANKARAKAADKASG